MRIVFAGTPEFAVPALRALLQSGQQLVGVCTQPDRAAGRGRKLQASPVKQLATASQIPVYQPANLRDPEAQRRLADWEPELLVVVAYGLILPEPVLALPGFGCWNIHASLLPRWRGAAPVQRAILGGDAETGVCIMQMDRGLDTGPVLARRRTPIGADETAGMLGERLAFIGAALLIECIERRTSLVAQPQPSSGATYASKIDKAEAPLDWRRDAAFLSRQVRAFDPWPVALAVLNGERLRVWQARAMTGPRGKPGEVVAVGGAGIDVATGQGVLRLEQIQRAGGRRLAVADFLNSRQVRPGDRFDSSPEH